MAEQNIEPFAYQKSTNIDEHNQIVDKVNEIVDVINDVNLDTINEKIATLESNVSTNTTDIATNTSDIDANTRSIVNLDSELKTTNTNVESLRDANLIITKQITDIQEKDTEQDTSITALGNADIATATSAFDNTARKLTLSLNPKSGTAITTEVNIPASGETGDEYTASQPLDITNKNISVKIDSNTLNVNDNGELEVIGGGGSSYVAGEGITIDSETNAISVDTTEIATVAVTNELATGVQNAIGQATTAKTTADTANTNALSAFNDVNLSGTNLVFDKGNGGQKEIELPSGGNGWTKLSLTNLPTDFSSNDELFIVFGLGHSVTVTSWTKAPTAVSLKGGSTCYYTYVTFAPNARLPMSHKLSGWDDNVLISISSEILSYNSWNDTSKSLFILSILAMNAGGMVGNSVTVTRSNVSTYCSAIYRRQSTS